MKKILFLIFSAFLGQVSLAQTDSTVIKLQFYKDLLAKGLIDSQEYVSLKAKVLGLNQEIKAEQGSVGNKSRTIDTEIFYDETLTENMLPSGLYMSLDEIKSRHPSLKCNLSLKLRSTYDYENGIGGNVMFKPFDRCVSKDAVKMDAWIYSTGGKCYVNLERLKLQAFYNPIITMGRFLAFYKNQATDGVQTAGAWGGSIGTEIAQATGHFYKKLYVIDTRTSMLYPVDNEYMLKVLKDYPGVYSKYLKENDTSNSQIQARYLQKMNDSK